MKFAHYITVLERDAPSQWQGKFVRYKQLKKMLKRCKPTDQPDSPVDTEKEEAFFNELHKQLGAINSYFQLEADRTVSAYQRTTHGIFLLFCYVPFRCFSGPRQYAALADRAYWCRKYARANAVALRKILKKHDKVCGNGRGREFLQQCWCSASADGIGLFLHSPLLDELKAVQDVLQQKIHELETHALADDHEIAHKDEDVPEKGAITGTMRKGANAKSEGNSGKIEGQLVSPFATGGITTAQASSHPPPAATHIDNEAPAHHTTQNHRGNPPNLSHDSCDAVSQSSDGLRGAITLAPSHTGSIGSITSPSLKAQRTAALAAIQESPTCMLDSSDIEWEEDSPRAKRTAHNAAAGGDGSAAQWPRATAPGQQGTSTSSASAFAHAAAAAAEFMHHDNAHLHETTTNSGAGAGTGIDPDAPLPTATAIAIATAQEESGGAAGNTTAPLSGNVPSSNNAEPGGFGSSTSGNILGPFRDEELRCPICLDLMYKPVGLGCGHKFCRPCALEAAGFGMACGAFRNIISYIPTRTRCPHCRQKNVYKNAVDLTEVGTLIRSRYPEQWAERRAEDRRRREEISVHNGRVQRQRISSLLGVTPFDLINTVQSSNSR